MLNQLLINITHVDTTSHHLKRHEGQKIIIYVIILYYEYPANQRNGNFNFHIKVLLKESFGHKTSVTAEKYAM